MNLTTEQITELNNYFNGQADLPVAISDINASIAAALYPVDAAPVDTTPVEDAPVDAPTE